MTSKEWSRREACRMLAGGAAGLGLGGTDLLGVRNASAQGAGLFSLHFILASSMYGKMPLAEILPQVRRVDATHIDIWPKPHGNQREEMEEMGHDKFAKLLDQHRVKLGMLTRYDLEPFKLEDEIKVAGRFGARVIATGSRGPKDAKGNDLKRAVGDFVEKMKPHADAADKAGVTIAIENHANALIASPDSIKHFAESTEKVTGLGLALAPYHLPQKPQLIAELIEALGPKLAHFYAWQYGKGASEKMPKEDEMLQLPGRGPLDFKPLLTALRKINYAGWISIFMHPVPRGVPILPTAEEVTAAIEKSRRYLAKSYAQI
ncbi:MAG TPA: TIM barrel protein [Sumerlaeia bacterium]|nr:TIM barrel protein [Sumerlaeia bacterium]